MDGYVRAAMATIKARGFTRTVYLAGMADAHFPEREPQDNSPLQAGQSLRLVWRDAIFHGRDRILGPITASIPRGSATGASGTVRSLSSPPSSSGQVEESDFFPALNVNTFNFHLSLPRFGLNLRSREPVENRAEIREIPPFGVVYELARSVIFRPVASTSNSATAALAGEAEIVSCNVRLVLHGGVALTLTLVQDNGQIAMFDCTATNETESDLVEGGWFVWPRPEDETSPTMGYLKLRRTPLNFSISFQRDIFFTRRWLVVSIAKPFTLNEGASAVRFPALL